MNPETAAYIKAIDANEKMSLHVELIIDAYNGWAPDIKAALEDDMPLYFPEVPHEGVDWWHITQHYKPKYFVFTSEKP